MSETLGSHKIVTKVEELAPIYWPSKNLGKGR